MWKTPTLASYPSLPFAAFVHETRWMSQLAALQALLAAFTIALGGYSGPV